MWGQLIIALVLLVASALISSLTAKKPAGSKPNVMADFDFPQFDEGTPECVVFGDCWIPDWMVLHTGDFEVTEIHSDSGGKK